MHQATIKSLGLLEDKLRQHSSEKKSTYYEGQGKKSQKYQSWQSQSSDSSGEENNKARMEDAMNIIAHKKVNKARYAWKEENYEDEEKEMGALCFTRRVRRCEYPKDSNYHKCRGNLGTVAMGRLIGGARRW
jgi:hypothetical protein